MRCALAGVFAMLLVTSPVRAQAPPPKPTVSDKAPSPAPPPNDDEDVDLANIVEAAMKVETTVQEAPAIVSVLTAEQIRAQGYRSLQGAIGSLPGFFGYDWVYGIGRVVVPRGVLAGVLMLRDGVSLYDPGVGTVMFDETIPLEMVRRVEVMSGPGGVLWGSNSFVGMVNLLTKTADDVDGVEASVGGGHGRGRPGAFRAYVMGGAKWLGGRVKALVHVSYETFRDTLRDMAFAPVIRLSTPNPLGPATVQGAVTGDPRRSHVIIASGNVQIGPVAVHWHVPFGQLFKSATFYGQAIRKTLGEDAIDCRANPADARCRLLVDPNRIGRHNNYPFLDRVVLARYRSRFVDDKLGIEARAYYAYYARPLAHYVAAPPSEVLFSGAVVSQDFSTHRWGLGLDGDVALPWRRARLLFGGEAFYDVLPQSKARFLSPEATVRLLPFNCPPAERDNPCPLIVNFASNRLTTSAFVAGQIRPVDPLVLDAGARVELTAGKRAFDPIVLLSGAAVWTFLPHWNLKASYTEGYRPPPLQKTDTNGEAITWAGNENLRIERSRAVQGEVNARLLRNYKGIRALGLRLDYSYTWITDFIDVSGGIYKNISDIGIHSVELLAQLALRRGHSVGLGYTFLDMSDGERGKLRSIPNQWIVGRVLLNLWRQQLFVSSNISVFGSVEDPNRYPARPAGTMRLGDVSNGQPVGTDVSQAKATDLAVDRIPPAAIWNAGLRLVLPSSRLRFDVDVYNLLDADAHFPEGSMDLNAATEMAPNPRPGISFFARAQYSFL